MPQKSPFHLVLILLVVLAILSCPQRAPAGGGPENVCLVVNPKSPDSMAIANHYIHLRHIPPGNVVYVPWYPEVDGTGIKTFRDEILRPIFETIDGRKLAGQIDYIVYSSNFPWLVKFHKEIETFVKEASESQGRPAKWPKILGEQASATGLTYLYPYAMSDNLGFAAPKANRYMRPMLGLRQMTPTMGFRSAFQFDGSGQPVRSDGERYLLSTMLAALPGERKLYGITANEALAYLARSAEADGTQPTGTIYFTRTSDIRTTQRALGFTAAQEALRELGIASEIVDTTMPMRRNDVLGVTSGAEKFSWDATGSTILPGAICDNLTSYGGIMFPPHKQTVLTEFLRHGAAGACGTVCEPYLILAKFPNPMLHVHYARGCSLAEAFYQSVQSPYQLLIMGDALCQPFARIPRVRVPELKPGQRVAGKLTLRPEAELPPKPPQATATDAKTSTDEKPVDLPGMNGDKGEKPEPMDHFEFFVDGFRGAVARPGEPLVLDTAKLGDGYHELRVVAVGPAPIFTQGRQIVWIVTANHGRTITATTPSPKVPLDQTVSVNANSPGAKKIELRHNGRTLGTIDGPSGSATIKAAQLGRGFNYLQVVGIHGDRPKDEAFARPIVLWVE